MTDTWETSTTTETWESNDTPGVVWTTVVRDGSDGGGGVTVHNLLTGRDATDSHPMGAITGLTAALAAKADTSSLATVATSGAYSDLSGTPSLGSAAAANTTDFAAASHSHDITSLTTSAPDGKMPVTASGGIALVDPPSGGQSWAVSIPPTSIRPQATSRPNATITTTLNWLIFAPLKLLNRSYSGIGIMLTTAGSTGAVVRLGLYERNSDGSVGSLLVDAGTVGTASGSGFLFAAISYTPTTPDVYAAFVSQTATCGVRGYNNNSSVHWNGLLHLNGEAQGMYVQSSVSGALPSSPSPSTQNDANVPTVVMY